MPAAAATFLERSRPEGTPSAQQDVLFVIDELVEPGGAERVLVRTIDRLPRERFAPHLVTFAVEPAFAAAVSCPVHILPLRRTYDQTGLAVARQIRGLVRTHNIQITHTFHETSDLWAGPIAKMSGCPILISSRRDMGIQRGTKHKWGYRLLGRYFDEVHTVSDSVRQFCIENDRLPPERVRTIPNGIDLPPRSAAAEANGLRRRLGLPETAPLVVSVGHIRPVKGFDILLQAAARVPDATFAIAGDTHDEAHASDLKQQACAAGLGDRFVFLGPVQNVPALLYSSDVFCLLSRSEGMSNALLEAMACGLPCVATRVGGNPEVVRHGQTGYIVESGDSEAAAARIAELLRNPERARQMGAEGRRVVEENFTTEVMIRNVINSYDRLLQSVRTRA
jgi:glycosyltransferase involved in cell wall biosynthesis